MAELPSWTDGPTKSAIVDFVGRVTAEGGPDFVAPEARIAVFDNDGTLWCEKPVYIQLDFLVRRLAEKASADASLAEQQPYKAAKSGDLSWFGGAITKHYQGDDSELKVLAGAVMSLHESMTVEDHAALIGAFFAEAKHPTLGPALPGMHLPRRWWSCCDTSKATASPATSSRAVAATSCGPSPATIYGIPPERVVGSAQGLKFEAGRTRRPADPACAGRVRRRPGEAGANLEPHRAAARSCRRATPTATTRC